MYFPKRYLTLAVTLAMVGCGSDSSDSGIPQNPPADVEKITITAIDGYLKKALVKTSDCKTLLGETDSNGQLTINRAQALGGVCVETTPETFDLGREAHVQNGYTLRAPEGSEYVTPITSLVVDQMEADKNLTQEEAEQAIVEAVSQGDSSVSEDILFGDYTNNEESTEAQAVELLAETLVDMDESGSSDEMSVEQKLSVVEDVSTEIVEQVEDNGGDLPPDFAPVVDENGNVTPNYKPKSVLLEAPASQEYLVPAYSYIELEPTDVASWFVDENGDSLRYSINIESTQEVSSEPPKLETPTFNHIYLEGNTIKGVLVSGGEFKVRVYAHDESTMSLPVTYMINSVSENLAPVLDTSVALQIEDDLAALEFTANETITENTAISITGLFDDPEGGELSYEVEHATYADIEIVNETLVFNGVFNEGDVGGNELNISAFDKAMEASSVIVSFDVSEPEVENTPPEVDNDLETIYQTNILDWTIVEGEELLATFEAPPLFSDADGDELTYHAASSLEFESVHKTPTGFEVNVSDTGRVSFSGTVPRAGDGETVTVVALDGKSGTSVSFALPTIQEGESTSPVDDPTALQDKVWYFVEYGSYDYGEGFHSQDKNWCEGVYFDSSSQQVYWTIRTEAAATECTGFDYRDASQFEVVGSYTVDENGLVANYGDEESYLFSAVTEHSEMGADIISLRHNVHGRPLSELVTWIAHLSPTKAQFPLAYTYVEGEGIDAGEVYITQVAGSYVEVDVEHNDNSSVGSADHQASVKIKDTSCTLLRDYYYDFVMNTNDKSTAGQCFDVDSNAIVTFNTELSASDVNSVIGKAKNGTEPSVMLNITRQAL